MRFESSNVQLAVAEKLQAEAKVAYRKGNYSLAINKFSEAIDMRPPILMNLLDGRAATYEKLEQLKPALNDAKNMMKYEKSNPKGYLRAGRILHLMDKTTVAIDIYRHGLKNVADYDPNFNLLKGMLEKAVEKQSKAMQAAVKNKYDPMQVLPLELLEMIMEYIPFQQVIVMQRVSKVWQTVISANPRFWSVLDFSQAKRPVGKTALKNCISKSKYSLTKAVINRIQGFNDTTLIDMVTECKDLEHLRLMDGFFGSSLTHAMSLTRSLRILILNCLIPHSTLEKLLNPHMTVEHLECWQLGPSQRGVLLKWSDKLPCPSFKKVLINFGDLDPKTTVRGLPLEQLVAMLPNVQELQVNKICCPSEIVDMTPLEKLEVFSCRNSRILSRSILYPASLRILDLACTSFSHQNTAIDQENLENLERINLSSSDLSVACFMELVPPLVTKTTHLRAGWAKRVGFQDLVSNYFNSHLLMKLEELSVEGDFDFSGRTINALYYLPNLKRLDCSSTSIKGGGIYEFIKNSSSSSLEELVMSGVERVSEELIKFAKERGIRIIQHQDGGKAWQLQQGENLSPFMKIWT